MRLHSGTILTRREQTDTFTRLRDGLRSVIHSYGRYTEYPESQGSSQASSSYPCSSTAPPPGTWVHPSSYFSAHGPPPFVPMGPPPPMTFAPMGPPPPMGSHAVAEPGPSHSATPFTSGTSSTIALSPCNIDSISLFNID